MQLRESGVPIPDDVLLEACTLQKKKELIDSIQKAAQARQQAEQMQMQYAMQEQQARTNLANSRAEADHGLYLERASRVEENRALALKQLSEANKEDELALLNKVKVLKEIDDMDLAHLEKLLMLANSLKISEQASVKKPEPAQESKPAGQNVSAPARS